MKNIAIIPARGGSRRIPHKNIKSFCDKPVITYAIKTALNSGLFEEVMVSTDDKLIAEISKQEGASVPFFRSSINSNDYATTMDVLSEVLNRYQELNLHYGAVCCIYPVTPLLMPAHLISSYNLFLETGADSIVPVIKYSHPIQRALKIYENGKLNFIWPENSQKRTQDLEPLYHDAGQFYWLHPEVILNKKLLVTQNSFPFILQESEVQDVDNLEDWKIAESKFNLRNLLNE